MVYLIIHQLQYLHNDFATIDEKLSIRNHEYFITIMEPETQVQVKRNYSLQKNIVIPQIILGRYFEICTYLFELKRNAR